MARTLWTVALVAALLLAALVALASTAGTPANPATQPDSTSSTAGHLPGQPSSGLLDVGPLADGGCESGGNCSC